MDERRIVEKLKTQLAPRYHQVFSHKNLATLTGFRAELKQRLGFLPVLNEVSDASAMGIAEANGIGIS